MSQRYLVADAVLRMRTLWALGWDQLGARIHSVTIAPRKAR